ncbi:PAS domain S-box protein, partial [Thermodesulfobacteriota bacterium]
LITEEGCLKCHAPQGYDMGDIRGGISVSVPMSLLLAIYKKDIAMFSLAHFALWVLGIMGIFAGSYRIRESISEREQAEQRTRSIIENMLDGLITLDEQGIIESLNASASRIFGYNSDEVVGQKVNLLVQFPQDWSEIQDQELHKDITRAMGAPLEVTGRRKDGSTFSLEISMSEMLFGAMRHFIVMTRDITEEKIKKAEALRAGQLAAIGEIAAGVAHEINNPINGIINLTQILLDGIDPEASPEGSEDREILSRIISEGDRISGIVRNLLDFARQRDEIVEEFMIENVIKDSISLLEYQFRKDGITWTMDVASNSPYLRGNPQQLQQVFLNLLSNARYSLNMRYKGQDPEKRFEINSFVITQEGKEYLRTTVTDFGTGMSQDVIDKIFDPLFSTKPPGEGTGLGLSISQNLVMEHQGYLRFESTIGDHTTAIVDLPIPSIGDQDRPRH